MLISATQNNSRQPARKVRLVANAVKKMNLETAIKQLAVLEKKASLVVLKVVRQAIANAVHNHGYTFEQLNLKNIIISEGPRYRRFRAVSRGRAHAILKRACHVTVELEAGVVAPIAQTSEGPKKSESSKVAEKVEVAAETKVAPAAVSKKETKVSAKKKAVVKKSVSKK